VEQDLDGFGIGSHDDEFTDTTVEGLLYHNLKSEVGNEKKEGKENKSYLGSFVSTLLELLVVRSLLN